MGQLGGLEGEPWGRGSERRVAWGGGGKEDSGGGVAWLSAGIQARWEPAFM